MEADMMKSKRLMDVLKFVSDNCEIFITDKNGQLPVSVVKAKIVTIQGSPCEIHLHGDFKWNAEDLAMEEASTEGMPGVVFGAESPDIVGKVREAIEKAIQEDCQNGECDAHWFEDQIPFAHNNAPKVEESDCVQLKPFLKYA
jgi:hypothetical protein